MDFAQRTELFCMNHLSWCGIREELLTFHRYLGSHFATSLIDYGLAGESVLELTLSFSVKDDVDFGVESDHSTLLWEFSHRHHLSSIAPILFTLSRNGPCSLPSWTAVLWRPDQCSS